MADYALFVPECNVDTALALSLVAYRYPFVSHRQGIGQVARVLQEQRPASEAGRRVVGLVDKDKKFAQSPGLAEFTTIISGGEGSRDAHCIRQHPRWRNQYLIVLNPACDTWLYRAARDARVALDALNLPTEPSAFFDFCKQQNVEETVPMRALLWAIQQAQPAPYRELANFVANIMDVAPSIWP